MTGKRLSVLLALPCIFLLLTAGCTSDSSNPPAPSLQILNYAPANNATQVEPGTSLSLLFTADIDIASIANGTFLLTGPEGQVDIDSTITGATVDIIPRQGLTFCSTYSLEVKDELSDLYGNTMNQSFLTNFATRDGRWSQPWLSGVDGGNFPSIAVNEKGDGIVAWNGPDGMYISELDGSTHLWSEPLPLGTGSPEDVAIDDQGTAWLAWTVSENGMSKALISQKASGGSWNTGNQLFESGGGNIRVKLELVTDNPFVVIEENIPATSNLYWTRLVQGTWTPLALITTADTLFLSDFAVNTAGQAALVWLEGGDSIHTGAYFDPQSGWTMPATLGSDSGSKGAVAINDYGTAVTTWRQSFPSPGYYASFYQPGQGWETPVIALPYDSSQTIHENLPDIDIHSNGESWLIGAINSILNDGNVLAAHYLPGTGWQSPEAIGTGPAEPLSWPKIHIDRAGNVLAYWDHWTGPAQSAPYFNRRQHNAGWLGPQPVASNVDGMFGVMKGSINGKAVASWLQDLGDHTEIAATEFY